MNSSQSIVFILMVSACLFVNDSAAQPPATGRDQSAASCSPDVTGIRSAALKLTAEQADGNTIIRELDKLAGVDTGHFALNGVLQLVHSDDVTIAAVPPYGAYREAVIEATRKGESIAAITATRDIGIMVLAPTINSPDIIKIMLERDGRNVPVVSSTLRSVMKRTAMGVTVSVHEGEVHFSCAAFAPGGDVKVTAVTASSGNFTRVLSQAELTSLSGIRRSASMARMTGDLVGLSVDEVVAFIGQPTELTGTTMIYKKGGVLWFKLEQRNGFITEARPATNSIAKFKEP